MKIKLLFLTLFATTQSCNLSDETRKLSGGWVFVHESKTDKVIDGGNLFIPCQVTHYGFNSDFIVAAQKPSNECFLGKDLNTYSLGKDSTYYWIVIHKDKKLIGPMLKLEYEMAKDSLGIPSSLKLDIVK
jgi:hypothetical protein